ncbi:MAG TPA: hypothetical protein DCF61_06190 [Alphaproteobacteria bacterium]|jgi:hypothetical protein|nr:hypothetical protein [Alphaproteobacteria bacterium]HAM48563.1 hypothetical protein [Alphaproteobacteria bacterium]HBA43762.1 hypothetical protein [Alphaproteobacteria bacterium]HBC54200.1 hypothetical protein [Alphaproteobacteria bacterium]HCO91845.1 hypothetical protein [Alphaproteobacteria bacterium]
MPNNPVKLAIRLLFLSFLVGALMSFLDMTPWTVWQDLGDTMRQLTDWAVRAVKWAMPTIILGAVIVVPIWLAIRAWDLFRKR